MNAAAAPSGPVAIMARSAAWPLRAPGPVPATCAAAVELHLTIVEDVGPEYDGHWTAMVELRDDGRLDLNALIGAMRATPPPDMSRRDRYGIEACIGPIVLATHNPSWPGTFNLTHAALRPLVELRREAALAAQARPQ